MQEKIKLLQERGLGWLERMDVTAPASQSTLAEEQKGEGGGEEEGEGLDPEDDFKREMHL